MVGLRLVLSHFTFLMGFYRVKKHFSHFTFWRVFVGLRIFFWHLLPLVIVVLRIFFYIFVGNDQSSKGSWVARNNNDVRWFSPKWTCNGSGSGSVSYGAILMRINGQSNVANGAWCDYYSSLEYHFICEADL